MSAGGRGNPTARVVIRLQECRRFQIGAQNRRGLVAKPGRAVLRVSIYTQAIVLVLFVFVGMVSRGFVQVVSLSTANYALGLGEVVVVGLQRQRWPLVRVSGRHVVGLYRVVFLIPGGRPTHVLVRHRVRALGRAVRLVAAFRRDELLNEYLQFYF